MDSRRVFSEERASETSVQSSEKTCFRSLQFLRSSVPFPSRISEITFGSMPICTAFWNTQNPCCSVFCSNGSNILFCSIGLGNSSLGGNISKNPPIGPHSVKCDPTAESLALKSKRKKICFSEQKGDEMVLQNCRT